MPTPHTAACRSMTHTRISFAKGIFVLFLAYLIVVVSAARTEERHGGQVRREGFTAGDGIAASPSLPDKRIRPSGKPQAVLTPHVQVTRAGRILRLDYQLLDDGGQNCTRQLLQQPHATAPRFTIWQGGQEIGSGTFEYG
jgi:hypothetical protein